MYSTNARHSRASPSKVRRVWASSCRAMRTETHLSEGSKRGHGAGGKSALGGAYEEQVVPLLRYLLRLHPDLSEEQYSTSEKVQEELERRGINKGLCCYVVPWAVSSTSMSTTSSSRPAFSYVLRCRSAPLPCFRVP